MKQGIVLRAVLAVGAAAGVVAISACSPTSSGTPAPSQLATSTAQAPASQPVAPATHANPPAAPVTTAPANTAPAKVVSTPEPAHIYFPLCGNESAAAKSKIEGSSMTFACDSTLMMQDAHWTAWNSSYASGTATLLQDDCNPDCAQGTQAHNKVKVRFDKPVKASCGEFYSEAVFTYVGKPVGVPDYKPTWTYNPSTGSYLC